MYYDDDDDDDDDDKGAKVVSDIDLMERSYWTILLLRIPKTSH